MFLHLRPQQQVEAEFLAARGPLAGLVLAVKDNVDVAGLPTTAACPGFAYTPERDAAVAAKALREAEGDYSHLYQTRGPAATAVAAVTCAALRDRADRIEREAGVSNADA